MRSDDVPRGIELALAKMTRDYQRTAGDREYDHTDGQDDQTPESHLSTLLPNNDTVNRAAANQH
jgi:hypothetical protein